MTPFRRWPDRSVRDLAEAAVRDALADAGIGAAQVHAVAFANAVQGAMEGQFGIRGQIALRDMDFDAVPIVNVENACASASTALNVALMQVRAGAADIALAVGAEKMTHPDTALSMAAFEGSWERAERAAVIDRLVVLGQEMPVPPDVDESARTVFMDVYAAFTRYHMARFGTTQRQLAAVAAKNHGHSVHNPLAQYRRAFTVDEVLAARAIAWPLTLPMCSPISDGAAAAVVCTESGLRRLGIDRSRAIRVLASVLQTGSDRDPDDSASHCTAIAARRAYERAGLGPADVSVAEVHDATAMGEIIQVENLGFCEFGDGGAMAERGETTIGGRIPVNPSGGLESKGHPVGATGIGQIHELVTQLRGEAGARQVAGARIALAENGGGLQGIEEAVACVTILGR
jgi:acetyl-CoA acetyltransferase